ncbi:Tripartite DNA replication factor [Mortierella sp. AM989]|nr:Tripartite DNA replication factor [Mortierella sp. AM989]
MPNMPKRKAVSNVAGSKASSSSTFKKSASATSLGSRVDSKLNQASLSDFFTKVRPGGEASINSAPDPRPMSKTIPTSAPLLLSRGHLVPYPTPVAAPTRTGGTKVRRTVIIEDDSDGDSVDRGRRVVPGHTAKPLRQVKSEEHNGGVNKYDNVASSLKEESDVPFEIRMPVSPPSTALCESKSSIQKIDVVNTPGENVQAAMATIPDLEASSNESTVSHAVSTPQRQNALNPSTTPPRIGRRSSPFRTPTEKSRRSVSTMESLGLSPQDSVFWVRTPPSEALKKLERMSCGRSHEEEIASIVSRLYETSSAGTALRTMARRPKDRIKDMLNTLRGSSTTLQSLEDELDDPERTEPASPTKELVDRHKNNTAYRQRITSNHSGQELGNSTPNTPSTPKHDSRFDTQSSPGDFDKFFTDLEMDVNDIEELTQLELSSASMSYASSTEAPSSSASGSAELSSSKNILSVRQKLSASDMEKPLGLPTGSPHDSLEITELPSDDFGDIGDLDDFEFEGNVRANEPSTQTRIDSAKYRRFLSYKMSMIMQQQKYFFAILGKRAELSQVTNDFSTESMKSAVDRIIKTHLNDLCLINESLETARESLSQYISSCQDWAMRYMRPIPSVQGKMDEAIGQTINGESSILCVNKVLDIEENIWSPMFGLKGKIDASVQVVLKTIKKTAGSDAAYSRTLTVPFELKTGKKSNVISHRAQTMLYTLLMTDRYDVDVQLGLLFYLKSGEFILVPAPHDEIRTILMQRNEIAAYEEDKLSLPPMIKNTQRCGHCFSLSSCTVLHKLMEDGTTESSGLGTMFEQVTDHLNDTHSEFFRKWNRLLSLEQGDVAKFQSQIWSMLSVDRQLAGNCFSNLVLMQESVDAPPTGVGCEDSDTSTTGRFARHRYRFKIGTPPTSLSQQTLSQTLRGGHSFLSSNISVGDPIVVSSEGQHYALAIGHVIDMTLSEITVGLDRPLLGPPIRLENYDQETNQSYRGLVDITISPVSTVGSDKDYRSYLDKNKITFRIDKDEMTAGISRTRNNLVQLFRADTDGGDSKRRRLIVDLENPEFEPYQKFEHQDPHLNDDQRHAVEAVLSAKDYALILGMPGTGKTTTIAQIIQTLVSQGKSVLLTSYTHSAVDNVLLKLPSDINIVRLGNKDKVHRDIKELVPDFSKPPVNTVEAIHNFYGRCQVVGTTCLGIGDPLFTEKRFDYCIVDEASQITLPACLGPIRFADVFVLVGDHNQLPPLVKNPEAKKDGFDLSLFKLLSDQHPEAVTSLTQQYRMNRDIMLLSNTLVYENRLQCATDQVASKVLDIPAMDSFRKYCHTPINQDPPQQEGSFASPKQCCGHSLEQPCWLEQVLDPQRSVVFIDTDDVPAHEVQIGSSTQNPTEALLVRQLIEALISSGISEQSIGVISVLRAQLKVMSRILRARPLLDIHTVDRYQGKDKDCVIVSLVRSNAERHVGELLKDWRRINVAFTRAKRKLVVFGSRLTLQGSPVFKQFLQLMEQQKWILKLAPYIQNQHPYLMHSSTSTKVMYNEKSPRFEDGDKENRGQAANTIETSTKVGKGSDTKKTGGILNGQDNGSGEHTKRREVKVSRAKADVILKQMPITKNIIDSL